MVAAVVVAVVVIVTLRTGEWVSVVVVDALWESGRQREMLALVCADVLIQDRLLTEVFSALRTLVWLLTRVDAQMLVEDGTLPERTLAVHASIRLLVRVYAQVLR